MPIKSAKQYRLMRAAASGGLKGEGPSPEVAKEFLAETGHEKRSKLARAKRPSRRSARRGASR